MKSSLMRSVAVATVGFVSISASVAAEEAKPRTGDGIEEVVVTAQRREQSAQDVGLALSVVGGNKLDEKNITTVNDLENAVPSLEVDSQFGSGQPQFRIRGVGAREYSANNASTVGIYVDEVAYPYTVATQGLLFDIARLEVLRGPQGTLYGRNTTGGAVNVISNKPTRVFDAGASLEYGGYDKLSAEGFVSGPLGQNVRARLAVATEQGGAWQFNRTTGEKLGDADRLAVRGRLVWDVTERTSVDVIAHWSKDQSDGLGFRLLTTYAALGGPTYPADTAWRITGWKISPQLAAIAGVGTDAKPFRDNEGKGASVTVRSDLGFADLTSVTAYQTFSRREYNDWDSTPYAESDVFFHNDIEVTSQELRLSSKNTGRFQWLTGAYYTNETISGGFYTQFRAVADVVDTAYTQKVDALGIFANASLALTDRLSLVGGLRYEDETRKLIGFRTKPVTGAGAFAPFDDTTGLDDVTGRLGLEWRPATSLLLYTNVSKGLKSGGFTTYNRTSASNEAVSAFAPEEVIAYEAGLKSDFFDNRLRVNAAAFYYDYKNQQVQGYVVDRLLGYVGKITNSPKSHIAGAEVELTWRVTRGFEISQYLAYKNGEYDEYTEVDRTATSAANPVDGPYTTIIYSDKSGERLPFPKINYGGSISYEWATKGLDWRVETNYAYRSDLYSVTSTSIIPSYWVANANLSFAPTGSHYRFTLWGRNIFNEYYEETRNGFNSSSRRTTSPHQPATFGIRIQYRY